MAVGGKKKMWGKGVGEEALFKKKEVKQWTFTVETPLKGEKNIWGELVFEVIRPNAQIIRLAWERGGIKAIKNQLFRGQSKSGLNIRKETYSREEAGNLSFSPVLRPC